MRTQGVLIELHYCRMVCDLKQETQTLCKLQVAPCEKIRIPAPRPQAAHLYMAVADPSPPDAARLSVGRSFPISGCFCGSSDAGLLLACMPAGAKASHSLGGHPEFHRLIKSAQQTCCMCATQMLQAILPLQAEFGWKCKGAPSWRTAWHTTLPQSC